MAAPNWRPKGILLAAADFVYAVTDKPLRFVRRFVKPLRIGGISVDLSMLILFIVISRIAPLLRSF
jgi:YggT family protein